MPPQASAQRRSDSTAALLSTLKGCVQHPPVSWNDALSTPCMCLSWPRLGASVPTAGHPTGVQQGRGGLACRDSALALSTDTGGGRGRQQRARRVRADHPERVRRLPAPPRLLPQGLAHRARAYTTLSVSPSKAHAPDICNALPMRAACVHFTAASVQFSTEAARSVSLHRRCSCVACSLPLQDPQHGLGLRDHF